MSNRAFSFPIAVDSQAFSIPIATESEMGVRAPK